MKIPILETKGIHEEGVISPNMILNHYEKLPKHIDTAVILFDNSPDEEILKDCKELFNFVGASYVLKQYIYKESIVLAFAPLGSPGASGLLEELIALGVKKAIACGSSGLVGEFDPKKILLISKAIRDEGLSYHYLEPSTFVETDEDLNKSIEFLLNKKGILFGRGITWTTDAFYRETKPRIEIRKQQGAVSVEMECAGLAAVAKFRGVQFSQMLYFSDIVNQEVWSGFITDWRSLKNTLSKLAIDIAMNIK